MKLPLQTALGALLATLAVAAPSLSSDMQALDKALYQFVRRDGISCFDCDEHWGMCLTVIATHIPCAT
jgi:hypothetical protein